MDYISQIITKNINIHEITYDFNNYKQKHDTFFNNKQHEMEIRYNNIHDIINKRIGIHYCQNNENYKFSKIQVDRAWCEILKSIQFSRNMLPFQPTGIPPQVMVFRNIAQLPIDHILKLQQNSKPEELAQLLHTDYDRLYNAMQRELNELMDIADANIVKVQMNRMLKHNLNMIKEEEFEEQTHVMVWVNHIEGGKKSRKYRNRWNPGYIILKKLSPSNYKLFCKQTVL